MKHLLILFFCVPLFGQQAFRFVNANSGLVLDTPGSADGTVVNQWTWGGSQTNQEWQIIPLNNGYNEIQSVSNGRVLDVTGVSTADGALIQMYDWLNGANQQWQIVPQNSSYNSVVNLNSGKVLDVIGVSTAVGANIQQWDYLGGLNQLWQIEPIQNTYSTSVVTTIIYNSSAGIVDVNTTVDWDYNSEYYYSSHIVNTNMISGVFQNSQVTDVQGFGGLQYGIAVNPGDFVQVTSTVENEQLYTAAQALGASCTGACSEYYDAYNYFSIAETGEGEDTPSLNTVEWIVPIVFAQRVAQKLLGSTHSGSSYSVPGPKNIFDIKLRAFIPPAWVHGASGDTCYSAATGFQSVYYKGDNRYFDPMSNNFRADTELVVNAALGKMIGTPTTLAGETTRWAADAYNPTAHTMTSDTVYNDCHYTDSVTPESAANLHAVITGASGGIITVNLYGSATNLASPLGSWAPSIDWNFTLTINSAANSYSVLYTHDCFPAHELYVNDVAVYTFLPTAYDGNHIGTCLAGIKQITGVKNGGLQ